MRNRTTLIFALTTLLIATVWPRLALAEHRITTFDAPGAGTAAGQGTFAQQGLNSGTIVGYYIDADAVAHGFIRTINGKYTIIDVPEPRVHKLTASMRKGQWLGGGLRRLPRMAACITAICAIRTAT